MTLRSPALVCCCLGAVLMLGRGGAAADAAIDLEPPPKGTFVLDRAKLLDADQTQRLEALGTALLAEQHTPLVVVTIESMRDHWPHGDIRIETFAHLLFDQWQVGDAELAGETWNTGIVLLVARRDRKARIQLGAGWGRDRDAESKRIMDRLIIPEFKRGRFGAGIVAGAEALDAMARGRPLPASARTTPSRTMTLPRSPSRGVSPGRRGGGGSIAPFLGCGGFGVLVVGLVVVAFIIARRLFGHARNDYGALDETSEGGVRIADTRSGRDGFWTGFLLGSLTSSRGSRSSSSRSSGFGGGFGGFGGFSGGGGGFSGGGGGGFSGGGGASGSW